MSDVNVDPSVLNERSESYSSLTDIYGVEVFTDEFTETAEHYQQEQLEKYRKVEEEIFLQFSNTKTDPYSLVKANLFMDDNRIVKEVPPEGKSEVIAAIPVTIVICIITFLLLLQYIEKRRRKWKEYEVDVDLYE